MATFTSTLPDDLLLMLREKARALSMPENRLMENAFRHYLEQLERAEYIKSYGSVAKDNDILTMAEEGMAEYLNQIEK